MRQKQADLSKLLEELPPIIARHEIPKLLGGLYSAGYMANADCAGVGPKGRFRVGRKICYTRASLIEWLEARSVTLTV